jgi:phosphoribosylamine--glycine ligase
MSYSDTSGSASRGASLTVLLLGSGGREHALAWKMKDSPLLGRLVCAPGNPGMAACGELRAVKADDPAAVVALAREIGADLVVVGPEAPLAAGVADRLRAAGIATFGPDRAAARLEWDKAFAKDFMERHAIPTAASRTFSAGQLEEARAYVSGHALPLVLKASGLAAGKGVVIAATRDEAIEALESMLSGAAFGAAGEQVVVEEFMEGEEASVFAVTDGERYLLLAPSQDHKRVGDGDVGPNTGGMGAYAPAPIVDRELLLRVGREIVEPVLRGMVAEGSRYSGCLYVGLMIHGGVPRVVEFNSRFGDPETQVVLPLYQGDLLRLFKSVADGAIVETGIASWSGAAVCVVIASEGYPGSYPKGMPIDGIEKAEAIPAVVVFQAGTAVRDGMLVTDGGRVLGVTAVGDSEDLATAIDLAYRGTAAITFAGAYYRRDIGRKGIAHRIAGNVEE